MKKLLTFVFLLTILFTAGCNKKNEDSKLPIDPCANGHTYREATCTEPKTCIYCGATLGEPLGHDKSTWIYPAEAKCLELCDAVKVCTRCGKVLETKKLRKPHEIVRTVVEPTCSKEGYIYEECSVCHKHTKEILPMVDHEYKYVIDKKASLNSLGLKHKECIHCGKKTEQVQYAANGPSFHGKLRVEGRDLVDKRGRKTQLVGLSTHGLQWFGDLINYKTFDNLHNEFGNNVIRLAMYTAEGGYCESDEKRKNYFIDLVTKGVELATELDMYVIIDWHCVGADSAKDKNPLTYVEESKEFFSIMAERFKDYDNVLYEIMNEPNGNTTWNDCKQYAEEVIPCIRKYTDAVVLVGNPHWTADLQSVMNNPLKGFDNIMYSYHFYANDIKSTYQVTHAYLNNFPVFISEHGGMNSDGDGAINYNSVNNWYRILDQYNISYVAWCVSNSRGSASIIKQSGDIYDFSDSNLKEWGIFYKNIVRKKFGLDK